jgi:hypothetical protein
MAEAFLRLSAADRGEVLRVAADRSGRPAHLLEKDVWVVWALATLFGAPLGEQLAFKGGTSLSKAYQVIRRFSEDVDVTYDIRALLPDVIRGDDEALPRSHSEQHRWVRLVRTRLPAWVEEVVRPVLTDALAADSLPATIRVDGEKLLVQYEQTSTGTGYVMPHVLLEFGARSTGAPASPREVACDAAGLVQGVVFPSARPQVMHAERTFWEKATAIHVFCQQSRLRGDRLARHWHDVVRLDDAGLVDPALADRDLANVVARHKSLFFEARASDGVPIDYHHAVNGGLQLVPEGGVALALGDDYARMLEDGLLLDDAEPFTALMERCADIMARATAAARTPNHPR